MTQGLQGVHAVQQQAFAMNAVRYQDDALVEFYPWLSGYGDTPHSWTVQSMRYVSSTAFVIRYVYDMCTIRDCDAMCTI